MEKIIVRNKIMRSGRVNSSFIYLCNGADYSSVKCFLKDRNLKEVMMRLFGEELDCELLEQSTLYQMYISVLESQENNDFFSVLYRLDDEFALELSSNIYLYHLIPQKNDIYTLLVPWLYADGKKYLGDTWWEGDDEIINNIKSLSVVEFLKRYKGYYG